MSILIKSVPPLFTSILLIYRRGIKCVPPALFVPFVKKGERVNLSHSFPFCAGM